MMESTPHRELMAFFLAVRTSALDTLISATLAKGVDTVVNLGAGMDTRPYRMTLPPALKWIEVDMPAIIDYKNEQLAGVQPVCQLRRIAADLADDKQREQVFSELAAETKKALVVTEGLIYYLTNDDAAKLSRSIYNVPSFAYWLMDYSAGQLRNHRRSKQLEKKLKNAPFKFSEKDPVGFFGGHGWQVSENNFLLDEAKRVGRKFPMMFPWNILIWLFRKKIRTQANRTYGYVLFGRG